MIVFSKDNIIDVEFDGDVADGQFGVCSWNEW
jgi:hypothetical protein